MPDALPEAPPEPPDLVGAGEITPPADGETKPAEREVPTGPETVPSLGERFSGVIFSPVATFRALEPSWGWGGAWAAIALTGMVKGILRVSLHDLTAIHQELERRKRELMTSQQLRAYLENLHDDTVPAKAAAFLEKIGEVALPWIGTLLSIVGVGLVLFGACWFLGGKRDLVKSIVIAAHAKMVIVVGYAVLAVATVLGNPMASTSLANMRDPLTETFSFFVLKAVDPVDVWHTVLLAIGLTVGLGMSRKRTVVFTLVLQGLAWILVLGWAAVAALGTKMELGS